MRYTVLLSTKRGANRVNPGQARSGSNAFIPTPRRLRVFCSTAVMTWFPPIIVAVGPPTRRRERNSTSDHLPQRVTRRASCRLIYAHCASLAAISPSQWLEDFLHLAVIRYQDFCHRLVVFYDGCHGEHRAGLCFLHARNDVRQRGFTECHQGKLFRRSCDVRHILEYFDVRRPLVAFRTSAELLKHVFLSRDRQALFRCIDGERELPSSSSNFAEIGTAPPFAACRVPS